MDSREGLQVHVSTKLDKTELYHFEPLCLVSVPAASPPVDSRLCEGGVPNTSQLCHIPCPLECQVSLWSAWGPCTVENCEDQAGKKGMMEAILVCICSYDYAHV